MTNNIHFHDLSFERVEINELVVKAELVIHPNPTIGFRISNQGHDLTYLPDHEPALGAPRFPVRKEWTSGFRLAEGSDVLIHDSQYFDDEYPQRVGFGHSSLTQAFKFASLVNTKRFIPFHHDPTHGDDILDKMVARSIEEIDPSFDVTPGKEGAVIKFPPD
jgi:phosphoribosyl 1,2-cyclic phosphodiesterase